MPPPFGKTMAQEGQGQVLHVEAVSPVGGGDLHRQRVGVEPAIGQLQPGGQLRFPQAALEAQAAREVPPHGQLAGPFQGGAVEIQLQGGSVLARADGERIALGPFPVLEPDPALRRGPARHVQAALAADGRIAVLVLDRIQGEQPIGQRETHLQGIALHGQEGEILHPGERGAGVQLPAGQQALDAAGQEHRALFQRNRQALDLQAEGGSPQAPGPGGDQIRVGFLSEGHHRGQAVVALQAQLPVRRVGAAQPVGGFLEFQLAGELRSPAGPPYGRLPRQLVAVPLGAQPPQLQLPFRGQHGEAGEIAREWSAGRA